MSDGQSAAVGDVVELAATLPHDSKAGLIRALENTALRRIDPDVGRALTELDHRFDRELRRLSDQYERRVDEVPQEPEPPAESAGGEVTAVLLVSVAAGMVLAADQSGPMIALGVASVSATVLVLLAALLNGVTAVLRAASGRAVSAGWSMTVITSLISLATAASMFARHASDGEDGQGATMALVMLVALGGIASGILATQAGRRHAWEERVRRANDAVRLESTVDIRAASDDLRDRTRSESQALLDRLSAAQRAELDAAVEAGVARLVKRGGHNWSFEGLQALRTSTRFELRHSGRL